MIDVTREAMAIVTSQSMVDNPGRIRMGIEGRDKIAIGLAKAFDLSKEEFAIESKNPIKQSLGGYVQPAESEWNSVPKLLSLRKLYIECTGDEGITGDVLHNSRPDHSWRRSPTLRARGCSGIIVLSIVNGDG